MELEYCATGLEVLFKKFKHTKMTAQTVDVLTEGTDRTCTELTREAIYV